MIFSRSSSLSSLSSHQHVLRLVPPLFFAPPQFRRAACPSQGCSPFTVLWLSTVSSGPAAVRARGGMTRIDVPSAKKSWGCFWFDISIQGGAGAHRSPAVMCMRRVPAQPDAAKAPLSPCDRTRSATEHNTFDAKLPLWHTPNCLFPRAARCKWAQYRVYQVCSKCIQAPKLRRRGSMA